MESYDLKSVVKEKTCFKSVDNLSCVDLFLTNCSRSFQQTNVISTGISDHHKMIITSSALKKAKSKEILIGMFSGIILEPILLTAKITPYIK